ncbi:MAG: YbhB/YbcL family Raf kinase inhibitor-like protein [Leptolyngbyaceae cyanobacterium RM2_2_4]|nr:YbhB/YbcL family Raf kinase inhibitor-like protein [Leptolyngbyaceae cyanobacterium SM1_4_3]NJN92519.1 YbhB/YbcL family Raf kinase inhibitor-like protein [Leptolyngbyaceae cyanobacterium SL_5_14]NJO53151.1 YbhB/YbcL family Raf kinase inhibitor-like protein [Leptolyngbyaceae cyanobacterium RM2_2_4]
MRVDTPFRVSSVQIVEGGTLPESMVYEGFGCTGGNQSPQLSWTGEPIETRSYAITMFDPDAPTGVGWWHWLVFNLPNDTHTLPQGVGNPLVNQLPSGVQQGYTDFGSNGYGGACPPVGDPPHRYVITIYALDVESLPAGAEATGAKLAFLMQEHILAKAEITGQYGR